MPTPVPRITLECEICTQHFERRERELLRHQNSGRFCSRRCSGLSKRRRKAIKCTGCSTLFSRTIAETERRSSGKAWCSITCQRQYWDRNRTSYPKIGSRHAHRVVAESLGTVSADEVVHHQNHDRQDFSASNLVVMKRSAHSRQHSKETSKRRSRDRLGRFT